MGEVDGEEDGFDLLLFVQAGDGDILSAEVRGSGLRVESEGQQLIRLQFLLSWELTICNAGLSASSSSL